MIDEKIVKLVTELAKQIDSNTKDIQETVNFVADIYRLIESQQKLLEIVRGKVNDITKRESKKRKKGRKRSSKNIKQHNGNELKKDTTIRGVVNKG